MTTIEKINAIMCWDAYQGEQPPDVFVRNNGNMNCIPNVDAVDIVYSGGLQRWAEQQRPETKEELYSIIIKAINRTIADPVFNDRNRVNVYPPLGNFFYYCQRLDRSGKTAKEAEAISDYVWNTVIARRNLKERTELMFSDKPDKEKFNAAKKRVQEIWGFSDKDVDGIRYFVCQTKAKKLNPSLNKAIYLWGKEKQTGKTSVARAIVTILNGDIFNNFGKYESTLNNEMQYNDHDIPAAALYNAVLLDEAMPKDSRKSYGLIKQVMTSDVCKYNQKFGAITRIPAKRYYFCTSNDDISDFIQDESERRFYAIKMSNTPKQISFDEIYNIWREFCVNAEPEEDWQRWYNSFDYVAGLATKDTNEVIDEIILKREDIFPTLAGKPYVTSKSVADRIFKNEPTKDQKAAVRSAMEKLFQSCRSESNPSYYSISDCRQRANEIAERFSEIKQSKDDGDFPF